MSRAPAEDTHHDEITLSALDQPTGTIVFDRAS
jgi:hypothetical protein